jgi:lariat debranching enzyme
VIQVGALRIGGLSGIYKSHDYTRAHTERLPYYPSEIRSIYHVRAYDVFKLFQVQEPMDMMLSHDWPANIEHYGQTERLWRMKPFFKTDSEKGELGSPPAESLLWWLKPRYWFSGHMHVKFEAVVNHDNKPRGTKDTELVNNRESKIQAAKSEVAGVNNPDELALDSDDQRPKDAVKNPDEIDIDLDDDEPAAAIIVKNPDRIAIDLDGNQTPVEAVVRNSDEIDLDLDDENSPAATILKNPGELDLDTKRPQHAASTSLPSLPKQPPPTFHNPEKIELEKSGLVTSISSDIIPPATDLPAQPEAPHITKFLALDKPLPGRSFLEITNIPFTRPIPSDRTRTTLSYDPEWLSIVRYINKYRATDPSSPERLKPLSPAELKASIAEHRAWVEQHIVKADKLGIPSNFQLTAPVYSPGEIVERTPRFYRNTQTDEFCKLLEMENWVWQSDEEWEAKVVRLRDHPPKWDGGRGGGSGGRGRGGHGRGGSRGGSRGGRGGGRRRG